jgi:CRISPR/Cas system CMR-associated protein Cmr3 (group 5 of RAMP superfamily)
MFAQSFFNFPFAADRVLMEQTSVAADIEGQVLAALGKKDRWLSERMRVAELIEHVLVGWCDLRDDELGFYYTDSDVLDNDPGSKNFSRVISAKLVGFLSPA